MKVIGLVTLVLSVTVILSCDDASVNAESETSSSNITMSFQDTTVWTKELPPYTDGIENIIASAATISRPVLNPRHGEPGHRCDIPVGQPLYNKPATQPFVDNSPLAKAVPPPTKPISLFPAPIFNPNLRTVANPVSNFSPITPTAGLNPRHGQPGHRCDIPVGQPLNSTPITTSTSPITTPNGAAMAPGLNPKHGQPGHRCDIPVGQPLNSTPSTTTTVPITSPTKTSNGEAVASGLNPKHGQPGHRCDIPVGKPLNSTPSTTTTLPITSPTNTSPIITPKTKGAAVAPRLNPKHGQPFHRCDILVGEPLDSKPSTTSTLPITSPTNTSPIITPTTNGAAVAPRLNPKHGQPFHRCDILVGEPLDSKPSTSSTLPITSPTNTSPIITPTTNGAAVAPRLNPKHGQPFHRCDILVGEPLDSKPAQK